MRIRKGFEDFFAYAQLSNFCLKVRSDNGCGFWRSGLKTAVENYIFWSEEVEEGQDLKNEEPGGTTKNYQEYPPPPKTRAETRKKTDFYLKVSDSAGD